MLICSTDNFTGETEYLSTEKFPFSLEGVTQALQLLQGCDFPEDFEVDAENCKMQGVCFHEHAKTGSAMFIVTSPEFGYSGIVYKSHARREGTYIDLDTL